MIDLLRRAWNTLDTFKQAYPENWHEEDEQVLDDLMQADLNLSGNEFDCFMPSSRKEREPIGEVVGRFDNPDNLLTLFTFKPYTTEHIKCGTLLYAPPLKEWVGLTTEEVRHIVQGNTDPWCETPETDGYGVAEMVEAKLREKNDL